MEHTTPVIVWRSSGVRDVDEDSRGMHSPASSSSSSSSSSSPSTTQRVGSRTLGSPGLLPSFSLDPLIGTALASLPSHNIDVPKECRCMLCMKGTPLMLLSQKEPSWPSIARVAFFVLHAMQESPDSIMMSMDVYPFIEAHWELLLMHRKGVNKEDHASWHKKILDCLRNATMFFESAREKKANGYWLLHRREDPWQSCTPPRSPRSPRRNSLKTGRTRRSSEPAPYYGNPIRGDVTPPDTIVFINRERRSASEEYLWKGEASYEQRLRSASFSAQRTSAQPQSTDAHMSDHNEEEKPVYFMWE